MPDDEVGETGASGAGTVAEAKTEAKAEGKPEAKAEAASASDRRIAELEAREKELLDRLARLQADFENFRRRSREDVARAKGDGKLDLIKATIPVLDNLERALAHAQDEGLRLLARQLQATLADAGLVVVSPEGEAFDAKLHEALATEAREGVKAGTVVAVVERGYLFDGRLLRAARVVVAG